MIKKDYYILIVGGRDGKRGIPYKKFESILCSLLANYKDYKVHLVSGDNKNSIDPFVEKFAMKNNYDFLKLPLSDLLADSNDTHVYRTERVYQRECEEIHKFLSIYENRCCFILLNNTYRHVLFNISCCKKYNTPKIIHRIKDYPY